MPIGTDHIYRVNVDLKGKETIEEKELLIVHHPKDQGYIRVVGEKTVFFVNQYGKAICSCYYDQK